MRGHRCAPLTVLVAWVALAGSVASMGCGDDAVCGPGDAVADGVTAAIGSESVTYGSFTSSPNNDCPPSTDAPISLTLDGNQVGASSASAGFLTFCLPRPVELGDGPVSLADDDRFQVIDVRGELGGDCRVIQDETGTPSGTVEFLGYCDGGRDPTGYAVAFSGSVPGIRQCPDGTGGMTEEPITITLSGQASVSAINL